MRTRLLRRLLCWLRGGHRIRVHHYVSGWIEFRCVDCGVRC